MGRIMEKTSRTSHPGYSQIMSSFSFCVSLFFHLKEKEFSRLYLIFCNCLGLMKYIFVKCRKSGNVIVTSGSKGRNRLTASSWLCLKQGKKCVKQTMLDTFCLSTGSILDIM